TGCAEKENTVDTIVESSTTRPDRGRRQPAGGFLDALPASLYVAAHLVFLAVGSLLWFRASESDLPYAGALALYGASQLGFFAYFGRLITMKAAVLVEQSLMVAMVLVIVLRAT